MPKMPSQASRAVRYETLNSEEEDLASTLDGETPRSAHARRSSANSMQRYMAKAGQGSQLMKGTYEVPHMGIDLERRQAEAARRSNRLMSLGYHMLGTTRGKIISMSLLCVILINLGALALMTTRPIFAVEDGVYDPSSYLQSLWFAWGCFFDPGTHTALDPSESLPVKTIATLFSVCGFLYNCVVLGIAVDSVRNFLDAYEAIHSHCECSNHILILGWSNKTLFLVRELFAMLDNSPDGGTIVILGEIDDVQMYSDLRISFPPETRPRNVQIICRQGSTGELDDLERVAVERAHSVIILAASHHSPDKADSRTLTAVLAIQALPEMTGSLVCEVCKRHTLPVLQRVAGPEALCVLTGDRVDKALVLNALLPSLGDAFTQIMTFEHQDLYIRGFKELTSKRDVPFWSVLRRFDHEAMVLGVCRPSEPNRYSFGEAIPNMPQSRDKLIGMQSPQFTVKGAASGMTTIISPPDDYILQPGDRLLLLMDDATSKTLSERSLKGHYWDRAGRERHLQKIKERKKKSKEAFEKARQESYELSENLNNETDEDDNDLDEWSEDDDEEGQEQKGACQEESMSSGSEAYWNMQMERWHAKTGRDGGAMAARLAARAHAKAAAFNARLATPAHVALVGWREAPGMVTLLRAIDVLVAPGSTVILLSDEPLDDREEELKKVGIALDGGKVQSEEQEANKEEAEEGTESGKARRPSLAHRSPQRSVAALAATKSFLMEKRSMYNVHEGLANVALEHIVGPPTDKRTLAMLPLENLTAIIHLATELREDAGEEEWGSSQKAADAASITTAVLLDELRVALLGEKSVGPTVVIEFLHDVTKRVLEGLDLLSSMPGTIAFHSNELETGLIAVASLDARVESIIEDLLRIEGNHDAHDDHPHSIARTNPHFLAQKVEVKAVPVHSSLSTDKNQRNLSRHERQDSFYFGSKSATDRATTAGSELDGNGDMLQGMSGSFAEVDVGVYFGSKVLKSRTLSFWDLLLRCRRWSHILVGWRRRGDKHTRVNPSDKSTTYSWAKGDILIVARHKVLQC